MPSSNNPSARFLCVFLFLATLLAGVRPAAAQSYSVSGTVTAQDAEGRASLPGATVVLYSVPDSVMVRGTATDAEGRFSLRNIRSGSYLLLVSFVGYGSERRTVEVADGDVTGLAVTLRYDALPLDQVDVTARRPRVEARGDTTLFNADAYRTRPDATAEELVTRMPGITVEDGRVQAQGEDVRRVLVDGDEFFGDDAMAALRNLPAEIVDQIAVFDQMSDQARFTGFDDGNRQRVMDIRTRRGMNNGRFGRVNSGYGSDSRYLGSGNFNLFDGQRRISVVAMGNNVNQQNFSSEDLLGISQAAAGGGGRRFGGGGGQRFGPGGRPGGGFFGGPGGWGGGARDFMVGPQSGISSVYSLGVNYIDRWNDAWRVSGSYFFNRTDNVNDQNLERRYLTGFAADQLYHQDGLSTGENYNHRINMRMEYTIDENRSILMTPRLSFQQNESAQLLDAFTIDERSELINRITSRNTADDTGYALSNTLLYRHRFGTTGRTFSASLTTHFNDRTGDRIQYDDTEYFGETQNRIVNDRETEVFTGGYTLSTDLSYTEPLGERSQLLLSYQPSYNRNSSEQDAFLFDTATGAHTRLDTSLSNRYKNSITTQRAQAGYRFRGDRYNAEMRLAWQHTALDGRQTFPFVTETAQRWQNFLPGASVVYRTEGGASMRLAYDARTRTPSARQLQEVIDDSDPLRLSTGNPHLKQQYEHAVSMRLRMVNRERAASTMAFVMLGYTQDYIGSRVLVAQRDSVLQDGMVLGRGARLVYPDNLGGAFSARSFVVRSMPFDLLRSNLGLSGGLTFSRNPSVIGDVRGLSDNLGLMAAASVTGNAGEGLDFRLSYQARYNVVQNSLSPELDATYYSGRATGAFNTYLDNGFVLASDVNIGHFAGLGEAYNQNTVYWNASLGYRFLRNNAAEVRLTVLDILGRNDQIDRAVFDDYIEDYRSNVIGRYAMVTFSYNFRSFPGR